MKIRNLILLFTLFFSLNSIGQILEPAKWTVEKKVTGKNSAELIIKAKIDKGWHLYGLNLPPDGPNPTVIKIAELENATKVGGIKAKSKLIKAHDPNFNMDLNWYVNEAVFIQELKTSSPESVYAKVAVEFMLCNDVNCLPPTEEEFTVGKPGVKVAQKADEKENPDAPKEDKKNEATDGVAVLSLSDTDSVAVDTVATVAPIISTPDEIKKLWTPVIDELRAFGEKAGEEGTASLWLIFLAGFLGGFIALFTPCVWPIIPMTVSFFLKRSKDTGRRDAILYGLSIVVIYVGLGLLITVLFGASALNSLSTNAVFNLIFFALLVVFAISFFGAFEITLPASWTSKMDARADATSGLLSIMFMAFTLVLVSFSCTGPIIGTLLVQASVSGSILAPAIGMLGFAIALAIPFSLFAFFPSMLQSMPKSGGWLNRVKVVLAFLELALSLKFLSVADLAYGWGLLDRETFLALWIVIFALLGLYLIGKLRFSHDSEVKHTSVSGLFMGIVSLAFAVYMIPGLWGAPLKAISAFSPPVNTQDFNLYENDVHPKFTHYEPAMNYAKTVGKPVLLDFTGFGCVNCRKMEVAVWTDPRVRELLNNEFVLVSLYVDDKAPLKEPYEVEENGKIRKIKSIGDKWSYLQRYKFGSNSQPFYVIVDADGNPLSNSYAFDENPENFIKWLEGYKKD